MNLPLHQILPGEPVPLYAQHVDDSGTILASCRIHEDGTARTSDGSSQFRMHSLYPLSKLRVSENAPPNVRSVHPYGGSNLLFLVLGKDNNRKGKSSTNLSTNASHRIVIWDDRQEEVLLQLTFGDPVINLVSRRDKLVVVLERRVVLFHLDFDNEDRAEAILREGEYETASNPLGLVSIATTVGSTLLAFPGRQIGHVQMVRLPPLQDPSEMPRPGAKPDAHASAHAPPPYPIVHIFLAHSSALRTLTLSSTGFLLCTSSNKGTLLRVFSTSHKALIRELRRGTDQADVWSVAFLDPNAGEMIACASDKRTVHVWKVGDLSLTSSVASGSGQSAAKTTSPGPSSSGKGKEAMKAFNILKPYLPAYFSSQWSDLTWRIPHNASVTFQPVHVAALAEQDDLATCFFVRTQTDANRTREQQARNKQSATARHGGSQAEDPCYLLVITRSGAWYKLSLSNPISASSSPSTARSGSSSAHAHQGRRKDAAQPSSGSAATKPGATSAGGTVPESNKCRLLEYRRIGYGTDGEEDDHNRDFDIDIDFDRDSDSDSDE